MSRLILFIVAGIASVPVCATEPPITAVAFTPDGEAVAAVSQSGLRVFSWPQLKLLRTVKVSPSNLHAVAFAADGRHLAVGGGDPSEQGVVEVFSWPAAEPVVSLQGHDDSVRSVVWLDESRVVSTSIDRSIKVWDIKTRDVVSTLTGHSRSVDAACLLPERRMLVSAGVDQSVRVWDLDSQMLIHSLTQHTGSVHALALRPAQDGLPMVASGAVDRTIRFWQPTIGRMVRYIRLDSAPLSLGWLQGGQYIAAACRDGHVRIVDADQLQVVRDVPAVDGWAYAIRTHPTDGSIVVAGGNGQIRRVEVQALPGDTDRP